MAEAARVIISEYVLKVQRDPRAIAARTRVTTHVRKRRADHTHNCDGSRHRHRGVSNPPGRPRDGQSAKWGGLLTPPLHQ